ncbi:Fic family protein [Trichlorobacter ammonificans]|uniref:Cell filamentation protein Fic n=1 Tax=Trichlorobacter ammonificans TaxID=2916410 RepID=A0ABM9D6R8_9BACT|nr:Fic family protein [Trichlorobacter ammonificans]CAH2030075.1 Cell filamentation protein Fic [Trichlorobacter ammonificans]
MSANTGRYITATTAGEKFQAFVPDPLPAMAALALTERHFELLETANRALGRLDGMAALLPDTSMFLYFYVRKEALLSSQIEGTQSSFADLLLFESAEAPGVPLDDVQEVSNYVAAMEHGLKRLREGFPLSLRLIREIHEVLMATGRGSTKSPGEFRRSQNWIGGRRPGNARFVPPPPEFLPDCLGELEKYLHARHTPLLVKAALAHVQFETIHPFLDGNGRLGRLLITLLLCDQGALSQPLLYLSLYFKANRDRYYDLLQAVRQEGGWETWLEFFLEGVLETSGQAVATARRLQELFNSDRQRVAALGRASGSVLRLHEYLQNKPIITIQKAADAIGLTRPTIATALKLLADLHIVRELTGKERHRLFVYDEYITILNEGATPIC